MKEDPDRSTRRLDIVESIATLELCPIKRYVVQLVIDSTRSIGSFIGLDRIKFVFRLTYITFLVFVAIYNLLLWFFQFWGFFS